MSVFKSTLRIINANKMRYGIATIISLAMAVMFVQSLTQNGSNTDIKAVNYVVQNEDQGELSLALENLLQQNNNVLAYPTEKRELQNKLIYGEIKYALTIPTGFFNDYLKQSTSQNESVPQLPRAIGINPSANAQMDGLVSRFFELLRLELSAHPNLTQSELANKIKEKVLETSSVHFINPNTDWTSAQDSYFRFIAYGLISTLILTVGFILQIFRKPNVFHRQLNASMPMNRIDVGINLALFCVTLFIFLLFIVVAAALIGDKLFNSYSAIAILNLFIFSLLSLCLAYFVSSLVKSDAGIQIAGNVLSLGLSFFGGIFIPLSMLSEGVKKLSFFLPTYWYTKTLDQLAETSSMDWAGLSPLLENMGILLGFSLAFLLASFGLNHFRDRQGKTQLA